MNGPHEAPEPQGSPRGLPSLSGRSPTPLCAATQAALFADDEAVAPLEAELAQHRDSCPRCGALARRLAEWPAVLARTAFPADEHAPAGLLPAVMRQVAAEHLARARRSPGSRVAAAIQYAAALGALAACWLVVLEPLARPLFADYAGLLAPSSNWVAMPAIDRSAMALIPRPIVDTELVAPRLGDASLVPAWLSIDQSLAPLRSHVEDAWGPGPTWPLALGLALALAFVSGALVRHGERTTSRGAAA